MDTHFGGRGVAPPNDDELRSTLGALLKRLEHNSPGLRSSGGFESMGPGPGVRSARAAGQASRPAASILASMLGSRDATTAAAPISRPGVSARGHPNGSASAYAA